MTEDVGPIEDWRAELVRLGGSIRQDGDPPSSPVDAADEQVGIQRYLELLDALDGSEGDAAAAAVLWSLHPIDDYGIYESAYAALRRFDPTTLGRVATSVAPAWLARHGEHFSLAAALLPVAESDEAREAFGAGAGAWTSSDRAAVLAALVSWSRDDEAWDAVRAALGDTVPESGVDPVPEHWPEDWRLAAEGFRATGRVDLAWRDERDLARNFDRVLALLELGHGSRWREVGGFLNILFVRRRDGIGPFAQALDALPSPRREVIWAALERADPAAAHRLREHVGGSDSRA